MNTEGRHMEKLTHIIVIYIAFTYIQIADCSFSCPLSTPTIKYVMSCPHNQTEWVKASKRKNCESMAPHQNCTEPKNFQYHCLINHLRNATLEVCAPLYYLQGYCAYYNTNNKEIMENYDQGFECLKFPAAEQCPSRYPSSDAYKYQRCYAKKYPQPATTLGSASPTNEAEFRSVVVYIVFIAILAVALVAVSSLFICWERKSIIGFCTKVCKTKNSQSTNNDEECNKSAEESITEQDGIENKDINQAKNTEEEEVDGLKNKDINQAKNTEEEEVGCAADGENEKDSFLVKKINTDMSNKKEKKPIVKSEKPLRPPPPSIIKNTKTAFSGGKRTN